MPKVNGRVSTTAMAMVKPGMAPAIRPADAPTDISSRVLKGGQFLNGGEGVFEYHLSLLLRCRA